MGFQPAPGAKPRLRKASFWAALFTKIWRPACKALRIAAGTAWQDPAGLGPLRAIPANASSKPQGMPERMPAPSPESLVTATATAVLLSFERLQGLQQAGHGGRHHTNWAENPNPRRLSRRRRRLPGRLSNGPEGTGRNADDRNNLQKSGSPD